MVTVGLGGIWTEALGEAAIVPLPADAGRIAGAIRSLRGARRPQRRARTRAHSTSARPPSSPPRLGELLLERGLRLVELNPVVVHRRRLRGRGRDGRPADREVDYKVNVSARVPPSRRRPRTPAPSAPATPGPPPASYDAIVVGGGHNGLTTAAYLAHAGLDVVVLERRQILGGACVTEEVWPGARVSRASYVVSMLQPKIVSDLRLHEFGYRAVPLDPAYAAHDARRADLLLQRARADRRLDRAPTRAATARSTPTSRTCSSGRREFLRPMILREPPALGSRNPLDVVALLREAGARRGLYPSATSTTWSASSRCRSATCSTTGSSTTRLKGSIASTGVVGVWAGPRTPGTAYNLLHHALGELDGIPGVWGQVIGGMGAISQAIARSAEAAGAEIRTDAEVASIDVRDGKVLGVTLATGEEIRAPVVASGAHPKTTILDLAGAENFPDEIADDMRRYRTRGGSVKINMVLSRAAPLRGRQRGAAPDAPHAPASTSAPRSTTWSGPGRTACWAGPPPSPTSRPSCPRRSTRA